MATTSKSPAEYVVLEDAESGKIDEDVIQQETPPEPKKFPKWRNWMEMMRTEFNLPKISNMNDLKAYTKTRQFKNSFKSTLAIVASSLFTLISPVEVKQSKLIANFLQQVIGPTGFMICISVLQFDLTVNLGGLLENFLIILLCVSIPSFAVYGLLHSALHSESGLLFWTFVFFFVGMWLKVTMPPRWQVPISIGQEVFLFSIILSFRNYDVTGENNSALTIYGLAKNSVIGVTLSLLFTACLFPHSATRALREEMIAALNSMKSLLELNSKMVFNEATEQECLELKQLLNTSVKRITTITNLCQDVEMEINQSLLSPKEYNKALRILKRLFRHLSGMTRAGTSLQESSGESDLTTPDQKPVAFALTRSFNLRGTVLDSGIVDILTSLRGPISSLNLCCLEVIEKSSSIFENNPTELRLMLDTLKAELQVFDTNLQTVIGNVFSNAQQSESQSEKLHRVYCFLFSHREFVYDLFQLVNCLNSSNKEPHIHWPSYYQRLESFVTSFSISDLKDSEVEFGNGLQTGSAEDRNSWGYILWKLSTKIATPSASFAFRTAILVLLASIPAFIPETKQVYKDWRAEWIMVAVSPSFGADALNAKWRVIGTLLGAVVAVLFTLIFGHNPFLIFFGVVLFIFPLNYVRLATPKYQRLSMISMLTFFLILLGGFTGQFEEPIWLLATKRALTICLGVTLVMLFSRLFWPLLARRELRLQLSNSVHNVALLYSKTISMFLNENKQLRDVSKLEDSLQVSLLTMKILVDQASVEPRIKGVFPIQLYSQMLESVQISTDILLSVRLLIMRGFSDKLRDNVIIPLNNYRKELVISILTLFWIVGESLNSKRPIPHHIPSCRNALKRMSTAFRKLMQHNNETLKKVQPSNDIILFSAYLKLLKDFVVELNQMLTCTKKLFGDSQFIDGLFIVDEKLAFRASAEQIANDSPPTLNNNPS